MALLPPTFAVLDRRLPGKALTPLSIKLPSPDVAALDQLAQRLQCTRAALVRELVVSGSRELSQRLAKGKA